MDRTEVLVIGAGPAGLAAGAVLRKRGMEPVLLEASESVGSSWRGHYDRLHLHTVRWLSGLPGMPIPKREGKWVSRDGVVRYLETYARRHGLEIQLGTEVKRIERDGDANGLPPSPRGVYTRLMFDNAVPILDVGLVDLVKARKVRVVAAVTAFDGSDVVLADGERLRPDAVIAATGFDRGLEEAVGHLGVLGRHGRPTVRGAVTHSNAPGLYFIGFANPISGALREMRLEAKRIARAIQRSRGRRLKTAG